MIKWIGSPVERTASEAALRMTAVLFLALNAPAFAQDRPASETPSTKEILERLTPAPAEAPRSTRSYRGITIERPADRPQPAPPSIDLKVNFESGSAQLTSDALAVLANLGRALSDPALRTSRFLIAGHTDNVGFDWYNLRLSRERAQSVADYLISQSGVDATRLVVYGFGRTRPVDPATPTNPANRRVQVVNLGQ